MKRFVKLMFVVLILVFSVLLTAQEKPARSSKASTNKSTAAVPNNDAQKAAPAVAEESKAKDPRENVRFRNLGPALGGGRVTAVAGIPGKANIYYVGAAGGGVFVTQDGGLSWKPIFEKE